MTADITRAADGTYRRDDSALAEAIDQLAAAVADGFRLIGPLVNAERMGAVLDAIDVVREQVRAIDPAKEGDG